jgi:hypothetical protein
MFNSARVLARLIIAALCLLVKPVTGQLITESADYTALANRIFRPDVTGVKINGVEFTGNPQQIGRYKALRDFYVDGLPPYGVVMSSGRVVDVQKGGLPSSNLGLPGDSDLTNELKKIGLTGNAAVTSDAAVLVVDVTVEKAVEIDIAFVFGSREYYFLDLSDQFVDVFGLFHEGTNIARIGNEPVSVKTVNCRTNKNCDQFIGNPYEVHTNLTGYTKMQVATLKLPTGQNQKVKIAVADGGPTSGFGDTVVFLSIEGFRWAL